MGRPGTGWRMQQTPLQRGLLRGNCAAICHIGVASESAWHTMHAPIFTAAHAPVLVSACPAAFLYGLVSVA